MTATISSRSKGSRNAESVAGSANLPVCFQGQWYIMKPDLFSLLRLLISPLNLHFLLCAHLKKTLDGNLVVLQ